MTQPVRVALFFDGKNHVKDLRNVAGDVWIDHAALVDHVIAAVGGDVFVGASYYTGVPDGDDRGPLSMFLGKLERIPGFFVARFPRTTSSWACGSCGQEQVFTREKQVDTQLVADVVLGAARDRYDVAVIFSGDMDFVPALEAGRQLGKRMWIASFSRQAVSRDLLRAAWGSVDLSVWLGDVTVSTPTAADAGPPSADVDDDAVYRELGRAQAHFEGGGGFLGAQYFLHRWRGGGLPEAPEDRRAALARLIAAGRVEAWDAGGRDALRVLPVAEGASAASDDVLEEG